MTDQEQEKRPVTVASFNQFLAEKKLMGTRCPKCGATYLPPRAICPNDYEANLEWVELSGKGTLAAYTSVFIAPTKMIQQGFGRNNPYCTGIVELEEGIKISARILGVDAQNPETIQIGTSLTVDFVEYDEEGKKETVLAFKTL